MEIEQKEKISVIVPIFNAEKYLTKCVDSILTQTYENLEIILIDDGSTDHSAEICEKYKQMDSRVVVIHKTNGGQASARNCALDIAKGDLLGFVDADDWIDKTFFETLHDLMMDHSADVSCCNFSVVFNDAKKNYTWNPTDGRQTCFNNHDTMKELLINKRINEMVWNKIFRRAVISNERFIEGMIFEDTEMMHRCLANCSKCAYTSKPLYYNFMSDGSTTRSRISPRMFDRVKANENRIAFYRQKYQDLLSKANGAYVKVCLDLIDLSSGDKGCKIIRNTTIV